MNTGDSFQGTSGMTNIGHEGLLFSVHFSCELYSYQLGVALGVAF